LRRGFDGFRPTGDVVVASETRCVVGQRGAFADGGDHVVGGAGTGGESGKQEDGQYGQGSRFHGRFDLSLIDICCAFHPAGAL
jgi:hypothetical protein